jgi:serine/threonine protein kinase
MECSLCKNKCIFIDFKTNYNFCDNCFSNYFNNSLKLNNKCEIIRDLEGCEKKFDNLQWISELSERGRFGYVFHVFNHNRQEDTVLKVQIYKYIDPPVERDVSNYKADDQDREMIVSCAVKGFPHFVETYDYWICDYEPVDEIWKTSSIKDNGTFEYWKKSKKVLLYFIEMKKYKGSIYSLIENKTPFTAHDKISICFEIFNALENAYDKIGFIHGDLKFPNIFYEFNNEPRNYMIDIKTGTKKRKQLNITCHSLFYPIIGDFGNSVIYKGENQSSWEARDVREESRWYTETQLYMLYMMSHIGVENITEKWVDQYEAKVYNNISNKEFLEWLGNMVIATEPPKKRQRKNF